jgi:hypothetical protein
MAAEVLVPAPLLERGMSFVDTPGIGSVFEKNTAATEAFLPQIDAAIAVIGIDPPLSGDEMSLIERVAAEVPHLLVAMNKADRHPEAERTEAMAFAVRMLTARLPARAMPRFFQVSATGALSDNAPAWDWDALVRALRDLQETARHAMLSAALARGTLRFTLLLSREIEERRKALARPVDESEQRVVAMRRLSEEVARRTAQLSHLFNAEEEDLARRFEQRRVDFRETIESEMQARLESRLRRISTEVRRGPALRRETMRAVRGLVRETLLPWQATLQQEAESLYRDSGGRFTSMANDFIVRAERSSDIAPVNGAPAPSEFLCAEDVFRVQSRFYFTELMHVAEPSAPGRFLLDLALPAAVLQAQLDRDASRYLRRLLDVNTAGATQDLRERVRESRRELEAEVRRALQRVAERAGRALASARVAHAGGAGAIQAELDRLDGLRREVDAIEVAARAGEQRVQGGLKAEVPG